MQFNKVGTISNDLNPNDMVVGSWTNKNQIPQKYWDKEENPEYIPPSPSGAPIDPDVPEFLYTNTFEEQKENKPEEGTWEFQADGTWLDITSDDDKIAKLIEEATKVTDVYIQEPVDEYNATNGTAFTDVHSCANYINNPTYTHYQFCRDVWDWNVDVWETARGIQGQVIAGEIEMPSEEEFIAMLPVFTPSV